MIGVDGVEGDEVAGDIQNDPKNGALTSDEEEEEREYLYIRPPQATIKHHKKRNISGSGNEESKHPYKQKLRIAEVEIRSEKSSYNEAGTSGGRSKEKQDAHLEDAEEEIEMPVAFDVCRPLSRISESANEELVHSILLGNDGMMLSVKSEVTSPELLQRELRESEKEEDMETELRLNIATQRMIEEIQRKKQLKRKRMSKKLYRSLPSSSSSSSTSSSASSSSSSSSESDSTEDDSSETDERRRKRSKSGRGRKSKSKRHRRDKGKKRKKKRRRHRRSGKKKRKARDSTYSSEVSSDSSESETHVGMKKSAARGNIMLPKISEESSDSSSKSLESILRNSLEKDLGGFSSLGGRNKENAVVYKKSEMDLANLPPYFPAIDGCRNVNEYEILEKIAEGSYGVVHKAKDKQTDETVALKKLKMEKETEGFPITSLREINTLLKAQHPNIVTVREIVVNTNIDKIYIVMDYIEHDLKSFMEDMKKKKEVFLPEEVKCLMLQLLRAVAHLHDNWILHRDLKTSNLLLSNRGILKVGDFGLAREYGSPLKPYSPVVVTLWYRAPEILLGTRKYSTSVDVWSVGCIFSELITMETLFQSKTEVEQINRIFRALGTPNEKVWSGFNMLPAIQHIKVTNYPPGRLWKQFNNKVTYNGMLLLQRFLTFDPAKRIAAREAQDHDYFKEAPLPAAPEEFAAMHNADDTCHKTSLVPSPKVELDYNGADEDTQEGFFMSMQESNRKEVSTTFRLRF